ncbi:MAG: formylglycine-generating enzyme family protein [Rhodospirillaceae bacterium]|nr:formylglycine-generating enzyme family protein [Rhodospirillaceae bacterium]
MLATLVLRLELASAADKWTPGAVFQDCRHCPEMVVIGPGEFVMGAPVEESAREGVPNGGANERPRHRVRIANGFAMARYEITRAQFAAFVEATGRTIAPGCTVLARDRFEPHADKSWRAPGFAQGDDHPVVCVGWDDAQAYAAWLAQTSGAAYRLPSEAEWEYAARAGTQTARFWGDGRETACAFANVADRDLMAALAREPDEAQRFPCRDGHVYTAPVGRFGANAFGLSDMLGNVLEWTADCSADTHDGARDDGAPRLGAADCHHVARGGGWPNRALSVRAAWRTGGPGYTRNDHLGLRVARDLE